MLKIYKMQKKLKFLKIVSVIIKISAWVFLSAGIISGIAVISGMFTEYSSWMGIVMILFYSFSFLLLYTVAIMADMLVEIKREG